MLPKRSTRPPVSPEQIRSEWNLKKEQAERRQADREHHKELASMQKEIDKLRHQAGGKARAAEAAAMEVDGESSDRSSEEGANGKLRTELAAKRAHFKQLRLLPEGTRALPIH